MQKYRVPLSVDATASATFFVEANDAREAIMAARDRKSTRLNSSHRH